MGRLKRIWDKDLQMEILEKESRSAGREYAIMKRFNSPYIVKPAGCRERGEVSVLLLPYYPQRSADGIQGYCTERTVWKFLHDVASGLELVHSAGMVHSDINPSNVIMDKSDFIISDFDGCHYLGEASDDLEKDEDSRYCNAPEWTYDRSRVCIGSDIWSLGASAYLLLMGKPVFSGERGGRQNENTEIPSQLSGFSKKISLLLRRCLDFNPDKRPSAEEIKEEAAGVLEVRLERKLKKAELAQEFKYTESSADFWPEDMKE